MLTAIERFKRGLDPIFPNVNYVFFKINFRVFFLGIFKINFHVFFLRNFQINFVKGPSSYPPRGWGGGLGLLVSESNVSNFFGIWYPMGIIYVTAKKIIKKR